MKRVVLLLLSLVAMPAAAQEGGGGDDDLPPMLKNPRMVSGQARPEQNDPPRQLTVRVVQGSMRRTEHGDVVGDFTPGTPVHLVGIDRRGKVSLKTLKVDEGGRAVFTGLEDGSVSYYALALMPRDGAVDRVQSRPFTMPPEVGMRMMLAGHARDSGKPPADDVAGDADQLSDPAPPGEVLIGLDGETDGIDSVELLRAGQDEPIGRAKVEPGKTVVAPRGRVKSPVADAALRDGLVDVAVKRRGEGVADIPLLVAPAEPKGAAGGPSVKTDGEGRAVIADLETGKKYLLRVSLHGRVLESPPFEVPKTGGIRIEADVTWQEVESLRARFTGIAADGSVYVARAVGTERPTLSPPFQLTEARGVATQIIVFPSVLMAFHGGTNLDDDKLWFQIQFTVLNPSAVPYDPGPGGLRIPLPRGFIGASVQEEMATLVKVDEDRGLVWRGAIPPGQKSFITSFALPTDDGRVTFDLPLPHGAVQSQIVFEDLPGMRVDAPGVEQKTHSAENGQKLVGLTNIERKPGEELSFRLSGLPQIAAWKLWARRGVGLGVLALLIWTIVAIANRDKSGQSRGEALEAEREDLLQALTQLEADVQRKKIAAPLYRKQRAVLTGKLEAIYAEAQQVTPPKEGSGEAS